MDTTIFLQTASYLTSFIPLTAAIIYWYKKKFSFDTKVNLIGIYLVFYFIIQNSIMVLAINGIHNSFLYQIYVPIEVFIFGYFTLSFQINSKKLNLVLSILLSVTVIVIDIIWGSFNELPVESLMVEAITITLIGMAAIPSIKIRKDYESSFFYFVFGILIASVNTLLGVGFIDLAPDLSFNIQAVVTITYHLIFTWGFYIILKSKSEISKTDFK